MSKINEGLVVHVMEAELLAFFSFLLLECARIPCKASLNAAICISSLRMKGEILKIALFLAF